jgi:hypothetical protein
MTELKTPPGKHANWAVKQLDVIESLLDPSKFIQQLNKIFASETVDLIHVLNVFQRLTLIFKPMDELVLKPLEN